MFKTEKQRNIRNLQIFKYIHPTTPQEERMRKYVNAILTEIDEKSAVALTLVLGKNHYARDIVFLLAMLFLVEKTEAKFYNNRWVKLNSSANH